MKSFIALVDCNNFYVSCERLFQPHLQNKPVLVLSNNDGCVVSRSEEAKRLKIPMGIPYFKIREMVEKYKVVVFSSNYALYGDLSQRVMETLSQFCDEIEHYSIDEAFLDLKNFQKESIESYGSEIKKTVQQWTGIPVSIGVSLTKTLSKVANYFAKKDLSYRGVCVLSSSAEIEEALKKTPIEELWGIGRNYSRLLRKNQIYTASSFRSASSHWIRKEMGIIGLQMVEELSGNRCLDLEISPPPQKGIYSSRSFSRPVVKLSELEEAVATYTARAAEKLRKQNLLANTLSLYISTSRFKNEYYHPYRSISLPNPTSQTPELISQAFDLLKKIYRPNLSYKKAGIFLGELTSISQQQFGIFNQNQTDKRDRLMQSIDQLNQRFGNDTIQIAAQGFDQGWIAKSSMKSSCYTTQWEELKEVS